MQHKNMSQHTEIPFPSVQIQTFHTDQKKKNHPVRNTPVSRSATSSEVYIYLHRILLSWKGKKIFIRIIYNRKIINYTHIPCVDCISSELCSQTPAEKQDTGEQEWATAHTL